MVFFFSEMNMSSRYRHFVLIYFFRNIKYEDNNVEYFVIHIQYKTTERFLFAILILLVDHSTELLFSN